MRPQSYHVSGLLPGLGIYEYTLTPKLASSFDGWSKFNSHFISHCVSSGQHVAVLGHSVELRPGGTLLCVSQHEPVAFTAVNLASRLTEDRAEYDLAPPDYILATDTEYTAVKVADQLAGSISTRDNEHVLTLALEDTLKESEVFAAAHEAAHEMAVWLNGSTKRKNALKTINQKAAVITMSETRFFDSILVMENTRNLWPSLTILVRSCILLNLVLTTPPNTPMIPPLWTPLTGNAERPIEVFVP